VNRWFCWEDGGWRNGVQELAAGTLVMVIGCRYHELSILYLPLRSWEPYGRFAATIRGTSR
jgi:hypothetical protein